MKTPRILVTAAAVLALSTTAWSQTTVKEPWVRATVPQQKASGMFAQITSTAGGKLVSATSPVAGIVEIHEMKMDGDTMRMRAIDALELPAGKAVDLKPGGHHVMLIDLKQQLKAGDTVPITLVIQNAAGQRETLEVKAAVRSMNASAGGHGHKH
jgi:periplasmic copper chaperone A